MFSKSHTRLSWLVLAAFTAVLGLSFFVPLYTDEVGSRTQLSRAIFEGGKLVTLLPQCPSSWVLPLPLTWYPAALLYAVVSGVGLMGMKISGIITALLWFGAAFFVIARTTEDPAARLRRFALFVAVHAIGVAPFTLVLARAEPTLTFALGLYAVFPLAWSIDSRSSNIGRGLATVGFVLLTSIFFYSHPKTLLFVPFVLLSTFLTFGARRHAGWFAIMGALVLLTMVQTYKAAKVFTACESPHVSWIFSALTLDPGLAFREPAKFFEAGMANLIARVTEIPNSLVLQAHPASDWLPGVEVTRLVSLLNTVSRVVLYALELGTSLLVLFNLRWLFDRRRDDASSRVRKMVALATVLFACVVGHLLLSRVWNFYMSGFVLGVLAIIAALSLRALELGSAPRPLTTAAPLLSASIQLASIVSVLATLLYLGPPLLRIARMQGTIIPGQIASAPIFDQREEREKIRAHARECGIVGDDSSHLVIDDVTLFAFERLHQPFHLIYVTDASMWGLDHPGAKEVDFLRNLGAAGIISRCSYFPTALVDKARRAGSYCCVGVEDLH